jgi:hypothetical protein
MTLNKLTKNKMALILIILISTTYVSKAQTEGALIEEEEEEYYEEIKKVNDFNVERFGSSFDQTDNSGRFDYSATKGSKSIENRNFDIFGEEYDPKYNKYYNFSENDKQAHNPEGMFIGVENRTWQQSPNLNQTPNSNTPSVSNPFGTNPGVKTPRNMDAVPDNGDDPNDVPLDGGILILGLAAVSFGYKKVKLEN